MQTQSRSKLQKIRKTLKATFGRLKATFGRSSTTLKATFGRSSLLKATEVCNVAFNNYICISALNYGKIKFITRLKTTVLSTKSNMMKKLFQL